MSRCDCRALEVERVAPNALQVPVAQTSALRATRSTLRARRANSAFTLVETLLALALLTSLLLAVNLFFFSMGELWGQNRQQRLFDQHVRAVTRYLDELVARGARVVEPGRELRLATRDGAGEPQLTFELAEGDRLLPWPDTPLPDVECALSTQSGRGLVLSWHSRWETGFKDRPPRTLVLSPLVQRFEYLYYDDNAQAWRASPAPVRDPSDEWKLPARLRLHFQYDRFTADTVVSIPPRVAALPAF